MRRRASDSAAGAPPRLLILTDLEKAPSSRWRASLEDFCALARPGGVVVVLRDPGMPVRAKLDWGREIRSTCRQHAQLLSVRDRLDLALLLDADALHLGEASVSVADARRWSGEHGKSPWISQACHDPTGVAQCTADGVLISPIAAARKGRPALGTSALRHAASVRRGDRPLVFALGGVNAHNAGAALEAGADGVAVIGAALQPPEPLLSALGIAR